MARSDSEAHRQAVAVRLRALQYGGVRADLVNQLQNFPLAYGGVWAKGKTLTLESAPVVNGMKYWLELLTASGLAGSSRGH